MLARRLGPVKPLPPAIFLLGALLASGAAAQVVDPETALRELRRQESAPHPRSEPEESFRLTEIGREYLRREDIPRAIELLSEAAARDSENRSALIHLTLAYLRHGDLEFAEFYFSQSLQQEPSRGEDAEAYLRLGDIYEQLNRLPEAIAAWQEVRRLGDKTPGLAAKLERSKVSWAYSHGQRFFGGELFDLYYDPEISAETAELADGFLEKEWLAQATFFGVQLPGHPIVILYAGRRYFHLLDTPDWVGGYYDGRIHVPIDSGSPLGEATFGLLRHELAHAYLHRLSRGRAPAWLQEGLAQYVEGRRTDRRELQRIGASPGGFLESSTDAFHQRTDRDHARRAYALALSFVEFLARRGGPESAVCLAYSLGAGKTIDAACEESFGEPLSGLERQWIASLGQPVRVQSMKRVLTFALLLALPACRKREPSPEIVMLPSHAEAPAPPSAAVSGSTVTVARVSFEAPARWARETPSSSMRAAQFSIPGSGTEKNASFVVYYFGKEQGGGAAENVERWRGQFTASDGAKAAAQTHSRSISGLRVTTVTAEGTFAAGMPMGPASPEPNSALWGAIVEGPAGNVFLKATGSRATMNAARAELEGALASIHPAS